MNIIDAIKVEHGLFYFLFDWIRNQAVANPTTYRVNGSVMMLVRIIDIHSRLEEELLFSALEPRLGMLGPTSVIVHRDEHKKMAEYFSAAINQPSTTIGGLLEAIDFARNHFRQEEAILFPLATRLLSASHLERLGKCWRETAGAAGI